MVERPGVVRHARAAGGRGRHRTAGGVRRRSRIEGDVSVDEDVIRRELAFNEGDLYQLSRITETQRRLYSLELFQFVNVAPRLPEDRSPQVPIVVTVAEGKHRRLQLAGGLRIRGEGARPHQLAARELRRRRAHRRGRGEGVVARAGRARQLHRAVSVSARPVAAALGIDVVGRRARLRIPQQRRPRHRCAKISAARRWAPSAASATWSAPRSSRNTKTTRSRRACSTIRRFATS